MNELIIGLIFLGVFLLAVIIMIVTEYLDKIKMERDAQKWDFIERHPKTKMRKDGKIVIDK